MRDGLDPPVPMLGVARVHAIEIGGEERGLVAAGARANFENHVLLVVRILGQQQHLDLFFQCGLARRKRGNFFLGHGAHLRIALGQHRARIGQSLAHLHQVAIFLNRLLDFAQRSAGLLILLMVIDDFGLRKLRRKLFVALFHLFQTIDHGKLLAPAGHTYQLANCNGNKRARNSIGGGRR